jgi:hypothetical protein
MRGADAMPGSVFTVANLEDFGPDDHPLRSVRQLCGQLRYKLLVRWFVGLAIDERVWDHSPFSKKGERLLAHQVVEGFVAEMLRLPDRQGLLSKEYFSVDGTLIQAWVSQKSFRPKDSSDDQRTGGRNAHAEWKGAPHSNDALANATDPDARNYRKSHNTAAILC